MQLSSPQFSPAKLSLAQSSSAQPSPAQLGPAQLGPAQPSSVHLSSPPLKPTQHSSAYPSSAQPSPAHSEYRTQYAIRNTPLQVALITMQIPAKNVSGHFARIIVLMCYFWYIRTEEKIKQSNEINRSLCLVRGDRVEKMRSNNTLPKHPT